MKTISTTIVSLLMSATYALASGNGGNGEGLSFMATLFIGFGVMIVMFQFVPVVIMLTGLIRGFLSPADNAHASDAGKIS